MNHYRDPESQQASCGNVCFGFGGEMTDDLAAVSCEMCLAVEHMRWGERVVAEFRARREARKQAKEKP